MLHFLGMSWPKRPYLLFRELVSMTTEAVRSGKSWLTWRCWSSCLSTATCLRLGPGCCTMYWPGPATSSSASGQVPPNYNTPKVNFIIIEVPPSVLNESMWYSICICTTVKQRLTVRGCFWISPIFIVLCK